MGANLFSLIYRYFRKNRRAFWCCFLLAIAVPGFFASRIQLQEDINTIIPQDEKTKQLGELFQQSKLLDKMIVTVSQRSGAEAQPDSLVALSDTIAAISTSQLSNWVKEVYWTVPEETTLQLLEAVQARLPLYLEAADYSQLDSLQQPAYLAARLERQKTLLSSPAGLALKSFIAADVPGLGSNALKRLQELQVDNQFELYDAHILSRNQQQAVLFITPVYPKSNTGENNRFLAAFDKTIDSLQRQHPGFAISYYGGTAVAAGNAKQLRQDTLLTQGITVLFLVVFLGWYFRRVLAPVLILVPAVMGALFSLAVIYLLKGSISVIALATGSVILGVAVNYSLHVLNHYRHEPDMETVIEDLWQPLTIGSLTTVLGFACLQWAESALLRDLGLFAALSLAGASISSLVFLPALLGKPAQRTMKESPLDKLAGYRVETSRKLVAGILLLTVFFSFFAGRVGFEPDMNRMNFMRPELKAAEKQVNELNAFALQSIYLISEGRDLETALRRQEARHDTLAALLQRGVIKKVSGLQTVLLSDSLQQERIDRWNAYWTPGKKQAFMDLLARNGREAGFAAAAFEPTRQLLNTDFHPMGDSMAAGLGHDLLDNYLIRTDSSVKLISLLKTTPQQKEAAYRSLGVATGSLAVDMQYITNRLVDMVQNDFNRISWMAGIIVFVVLLVSFGRIELALVTFIPMLISWIWILGIMGITGMRFNIINVIISALIFGLGDDYSLFTLEGLLQEYKTGKKNSTSFRSSILLSAITTLAGLGVLLFAKHPSLRSIAGIAITGIGSVVLISQVLIPWLFRLLITDRTKKGKYPWTAFYLFTSVFSLGCFTVGSFLVNCCAFVMVRANPFAGRRTKYAYHCVIYAFNWWLMRVMANVRKTTMNTAKEDFSRPAIIICNHQSSLDVVAVMQLHPKLVMFTNERVWRSPFFGYGIRAAGYLPFGESRLDGQLPRLKELIAEGYSVVVFPEGTRSASGNLQRFHKGAFLLAEQLQLDILPVMLIGTGYTLYKNDLMLRNGAVEIHYLPRIRFDDGNWGKGYAVRTKTIGRFFREQYNTRRQEVENADLYREKLVSNYVYKGPVLEWYLRVKSRLEKNYKPLLRFAPPDAKILDLGCGYGFLCYMLQYTGQARQITGIDYDAEKIAVAQRGWSRGESLQFYQGDITSLRWEAYDLVYILDVLHYLQPHEQEMLVTKALQHLRPGGKLVVRDGDAGQQEKHEKTKLTELFSTKLLGFNQTSGDLHFTSAGEMQRLAAANGFSLLQEADSRRTSNTIFVFTKTAAGV
ncbi:MAG: 1-acyl-sn-glycerol-3-phosphate acyltransferase [Flavihumibacter sp.]